MAGVVEERPGVTRKQLTALEKEHEELTSALAEARSEVERITQELGQVAGDNAAFAELDAKRVEPAREVERLELRAGQLEAEIEEARRQVEAAEHDRAVELAQTRVHRQQKACESAARAFRRALKALVAAGEELKRHRSLVSEAKAAARELGFEPDTTDEFDWLADWRPLPHSKALYLEEVEATLTLRPDISRLQAQRAYEKTVSERPQRIAEAVARRLKGQPLPALSADEAAEADERYWKAIHEHLTKKSPAGRDNFLRSMDKAGRKEYAARLGSDAFDYEPSRELSREERERLARVGQGPPL